MLTSVMGYNKFNVYCLYFLYLVSKSYQYSIKGGTTALQVAIEQKVFEIASFLVKEGANISLKGVLVCLFSSC